jgi:hypothetical protein
MAEKRQQERDFLRKMMAENEANKAKAQRDASAEKQGDIQALMEYGRMLDKQDEDRTREFNQRERRAQQFMNNLASKVITKQQTKKQAEDEMLAKYEHDREMRLRQEDERRMQREANDKQRMRDLLNKQMQEKKEREAAEKAHNDEQAMIWRRDKENYEEEERRLKNKIAAINAENCEFLKRQMDEKAGKQAKRMNREEFNMNKQVLKEINQKRKVDAQSHAE